MKMRAVQVAEKNGPLHLVERDVPEPGPGEVRVRVEACGVCHSDSMAVEGTYPGTSFPRVPGHEIAGRIDAVGQGVQGWTAGQRVGVGWSALSGVRPMIETLPLERAPEAYARMMSGAARFRMVLTT